MVRNYLNSYFILVNDLDSTTSGYMELASQTANGGKGWQPIGAVYNQFAGSFNGQGYEIRDLFINRPDEDGVGLFGVVQVGGVIQNVGVVTGSVSGRNYVGGLAGYNYGTVSNSSYSTGRVDGQYYVGGLVGVNYGDVSESYATGSVQGEIYVGGLVAVNYGDVNNCYATGSVSGTDYVGGLVGYGDDGGVANSFWDIETSGQETSAGGEGKTTAEMMDIDTFTKKWDIIGVKDPNDRNTDYIWNIVDDQTYPFLSWQPV